MTCTICHGTGIEEWGDSSGHPQHSAPCPKCSVEVTKDQYFDLLPGAPMAGGYIVTGFSHRGKYFVAVDR